MNRTLKSAWRYGANEQGFALPIAVGMGMIMILVGITMMIRSQGDQVTASAQKATSRGQGAAETGITRFQSLINQYRAIATYCANTSAQPPSCNTGTTWSNVTVNTPRIKNSCKDTNTIVKTIQDAAATTWQSIDANDARKGQYRLVSYTYTPNAGTANNAPGTGTLTVEGRVNQSNIGSTATTRLQVTIPVRTSTTFPEMWVGQYVSTGSTSANVLAPCTGTALASLNPGYSLTRSNLPMPQIPARSTTYLNASGTPETISNLSTFQRIDDPTGTMLPRATDLPTRTSTGEVVYEYSVGQITDTFNITPGYKVAIYLDGNINMTGGQKAILHQCENLASQDPSNGSLRGWSNSCSPTDARIYGLSASGTLSLDENSSICDIFFLAPTYAVSLSDDGEAQECRGDDSNANNNGVYWVKSWDGGGQGEHTSLDQTSASWTDVSFLLPLPLQIAPVSTWQRQEAR